MKENIRLIYVFSLILISLTTFLSSCASKEEIRLRELKFQKEVENKSDFELCKKVRIQDWPPTWGGGKGVFWYVTESSYRKELIRRGVTSFLCSNASKACVGYGFNFRSEKHRDCTINVGRNMAQIRAKALELKKQRDYETLRNLDNQNNQPDFVTPYLRKIERVDPWKTNSRG
jgi:hypothetical protein